MRPDQRELDEHGPDRGDEEARRMHALLCAVLLGEASEAERAEVERALEASPELCAERERIAATIALVGGALKEGAGDSLRPEATAALTAAAGRRRAPRRWYASPAFRLAAS
ncbi:MAG TPA: hypothetical protein VML54_05440, partial [Candidatus Limnocylindrales bacterium]|nr:hypothetical protein [Candidatus Limnocylindrales bacterium]